MPVKHGKLYNDEGKIIAATIPYQDMTAWVGQGPISPRTNEHLGTSDAGVILYHKMLLEEIEKVERGEDPLGTIRDSAVNEPWIQIRRERIGYQAFRGDEARERVRQLAGSRA